MKIRNEPHHIVETIRSILNWNKIHIAVPPKNGTGLRDGIVQSLRQYLISLKRDNYSKYCIILNLRNGHHVDNTRTPRKQQHQQERRQSTLITYLLYKFTQLCFVIVLLMPFLLTYNTLIHQASGQYVIDPISTSNSNSSGYQINQIIDIPAEIESKHKLYNNKSLQHNNNGRNNHITTKSRNPTYSYNHRLNGYSLIILSHFANHINSRAAEARILSTNPDSILYTNDSSIRNKRYIDLKNNSPTREFNNKEHKADGQILKVSFENNKDNDNNMYKQIIKNKEKLAKLVMNGLGLKNLPDMKKANISQEEYSTKYLEYLERLRKSDVWKNNEGQTEPAATSLQILSIVTNKFSDITRKRWHHKRLARSTGKREKKPIRKNHGHNLGESDKTNILLQFPLSLNDDQFKYEQINEANVRLMMLYNPSLAVSSRSESISRGNRRKINNRHYENSEKDCKNNNDNYAIPSFIQNQKSRNRKSKVHILNLKVYQLLRMNKRHQLDARRIEFESSNYRGGMSEETRSQWLEFDVTTAVRAWLNKSHDNLGIEIQCDKCRRIGARILSEVSTPSRHHQTVDESDDNVHDKFHLTPVLNIIGHVGRTHREEAVHPNHHNLTSNNRNQSNGNDYFNHRQPNSIQKSPNSCYRAHQRCCRHQLDVAFKDIKGFEFIIQPKTFDAGFCKGRCPPRHNPAHHHALLQSLIWQQDHNRVPRPCCAPSKLTEIEILHVDEEHSDKLKISTWSNMQVLECACS